VEVILFGSQARGEATEESDIDVVVTVSKLNKKTLDLILEVAWEVGFEAGKVISVIPATFEEMERLSASPFFQALSVMPTFYLNKAEVFGASSIALIMPCFMQYSLF